MNYIVSFFNIVLFDVINFYWRKILKKLSFSFSNSILLIKSLFSKFQLEGNIIEYHNKKYHSNGYCNQWRFTINYSDGIPIINIDKIHIFISLEDIPFIFRKQIENSYDFKSCFNTIILEIINDILLEFSNRLILTINNITIETNINNIDYKLKLKGILVKKIDNEILTEIKKVKLNNLPLANRILIKNTDIVIEKLLVKLETLLYLLEICKYVQKYPELFIGNSETNLKLIVESVDIKINKKICLFGWISNITYDKILQIEKIELSIGSKTIKLLEISNFGYSSYFEIEDILLTIGNRRQKFLSILIGNLIEILKEHFPKLPKESPILTPQIRPISNNSSPYIEPLTLVSNYLENIDEDLLSSVIEIKEEVSNNFPNILLVNNLKIKVLVEKGIENNWVIKEFQIKKLLNDFIVNCNELLIDNNDYTINTKTLSYKSIGSSVIFEPGIIVGKAKISSRDLKIDSFKIFYKFIGFLVENHNQISKIVGNEDRKLSETLKSIEFSNTKLIISYNPNTVRFYDILIGNLSEMVNLCNIENMELYFSEFKVYRPNSFIEFLKKYLNHIISEIKNRNWETIINHSPLKSIHSTGKYVMNIPEVYNRIMRIIS